MKKLVLFLSILFLSFNGFAQNKYVDFMWQPDGTFLAKDSLSYQVVEFEGKTKENLYSEILVSASSLYNSPTQTISSVENKLISINAVQPIVWKVGGLLGAVTVNINYVIKIHIKDYKVKVDAPYITLLTFSPGGTQPEIAGWIKSHKFFNKDGSISNKKNQKQFVLDVNNAFNNIINSFFQSSDSTEDDW